MQSRLLLTLCGLAAMAITAALGRGPAAAQDPPKFGSVKSITRQPDEFGDLAQALRIHKAVGGYELAAPPSRVRLRFDFYHQAGKVRSVAQPIWIQSTADAPATSGRYAVHVIDLDFLPLGGAKPGQYRIHYQFAVAAARVANSVDVPKAVFNAGRNMATQSFRPGAAKPGEAPLAAFVGNATSFRPFASPEEVVQGNPTSDVLVVVLEYQ